MELLYKLTDVLNSANPSEDIKGLITGNAEIQTYKNGSITVHLKGGGGGRKVMVSAVLDANRVIITSVKENSAEFELLGKIEKSAVSDREVFKDNKSVGVIRSKYKDGKLESQKIELWDENSVKTGDILTFNNTLECKGDKLYGFGVNQIIPYKIALSVINKINLSVNDLYFTLSFSEKSARAAAQTIKPDFIFPIYCAETSDDFKTSSGCGIVYKDGNAVCEAWVRDIMTVCANDAYVKYQPYIGKSTPLTEQLGITGGGPSVGGICIPTEHLKSACPIADKQDIQSAEELLIKLLSYEY